MRSTCPRQSSGLVGLIKAEHPHTGRGVQLRQIELRNFRSFLAGEVSFEEKLTVLVGENNGGKSNIIDGIRLISTPLSGRREIYCEETDIRFGSAQRAFEIEATFCGLSPPQQGRLLSATIPEGFLGIGFGLHHSAITANPFYYCLRKPIQIG